MTLFSSQGGLANSSGNTLEKTVIGTLTSKGFILVPYAKFKKSPDSYGTELLIKDFPYQSIYNHKGKTEFVLKSKRYDLDLRIECKWQQSAGSVDEKFPYLYLNCLFQMPENSIFIIVGGGGYKPGALEWLKKVCEERWLSEKLDASKDIRVMDIETFLIWANKTIR
jgi:hypothetical protein